MLPDYITGQGNGEKYGGGTDGRNVGAYVDTQTGRGRQTDWPGERVERDGGEPIKKRKERKQQLSIAFSSHVYSLSARHISNSAHPHTETERSAGQSRPCRGALVASRNKKEKRDIKIKNQSKWRKHGLFDLQGHLQLKSELMLTN